MKRNMIISLDGKWNLSYMPDSQYKALEFKPSSSGMPGIAEAIPADVPGVFEQDLYRAGKTGDPYFGLNILDVQKLECMHLFYYRNFDCDFADDGGVYLCFEGIDTYADIYINGEFIGSADNMLIPHELEVPCYALKNGSNEIFVHITPVPVAARDLPVPASSNCLPYNYDLLYTRKAMSMGGWDIMPRVMGGGMWRSVYFGKKKNDRIDDLFVYACDIGEGGICHIKCRYTLSVAGDYITDYRLKIRGVCGDSVFERTLTPRAVCGDADFWIDGAKLWWPRNYGNPDLYDVTAELCLGDDTVDTYSLRTGLRTVRLDRTSTTDREGSREFCFVINGKKVFWLGSNWVPMDAFHSNDEERVGRAFELLKEIGCNGLRCWGGNVYESDRFFELCDENGIMVWQDFAMACGVFPQENRFYEMIAEEAEAVVKRLRSHPAIVLWAGDNECDYSYMNGSGVQRDPNGNVITRRVIPDIIAAHDVTRPYLPSSPYIDTEGFRAGGGDGRGALSEDHLWGPRDYYKGNYYKNSVCHFASETGYHGCPSPSSLRRFLSEEAVWPWYDRDVLEKEKRYVENVEWRVHSSSPETDEHAIYAYRIRLMVNQVKTLFGEVPEDIVRFSMASQISQGEAFKYFIERFRISKWRRTGIIWWNLIDGWPQISDAVTDYYYHKKMAFYYIKRSQAPVCFAFNEPEEREGRTVIELFGMNDLQKNVECKFRVARIGNVGQNATGPMREQTVSEGCAVLSDNSSTAVAAVASEDHAFYKITWSYEYDGQTVTGENSYLAGDPVISLDRYTDALNAAGFNDFTE